MALNQTSLFRSVLQAVKGNSEKMFAIAKNNYEASYKFRLAADLDRAKQLSHVFEGPANTESKQ